MASIHARAGTDCMRPGRIHVSPANQEPWRASQFRKGPQGPNLRQSAKILTIYNGEETVCSLIN